MAYKHNRRPAPTSDAPSLKSKLQSLAAQQKNMQLTAQDQAEIARVERYYQRFTGNNPFLIWCQLKAAGLYGMELPELYTFHQWQERGRQVDKGQKSLVGIFAPVKPDDKLVNVKTLALFTLAQTKEAETPVPVEA